MNQHERDLRITMHPVKHRIKTSVEMSLFFGFLGSWFDFTAYYNVPHTLSQLIVPIASGLISGAVVGESLGRLQIKRATRRINNRYL